MIGHAGDGDHSQHQPRKQHSKGGQRHSPSSALSVGPAIVYLDAFVFGMYQMAQALCLPHVPAYRFHKRLQIISVNLDSRLVKAHMFDRDLFVVGNLFKNNAKFASYIYIHWQLVLATGLTLSMLIVKQW